MLIEPNRAGLRVDPSDIAIVIGWCGNCREAHIGRTQKSADDWAAKHVMKAPPHTVAVRFVYAGDMDELMIALSFGIRNYHPRQAR